MAFNDEFYVTTKALHNSIYNGYGNTRQDDESFKIGITAKSWTSSETKWFLPPVKQIVIIENCPVIFGDKVFVINPPQTVEGSQTYQLVSLADGAELFRGTTAGNFSQIGKDLFNRANRRLRTPIRPTDERGRLANYGQFSLRGDCRDSQPSNDCCSARKRCADD